MTSLRVQLAVPAALVATAFGLCLILVVLTSLRSQLAASLRTSAERQAIVLESPLVDPRSLDDLLPAGIVVVRFTENGRVLPFTVPPEFPDLQAISTPEEIPAPESFLTSPYVGTVLPQLKSPANAGNGSTYRIGVLLSTRNAVTVYEEVRIRLVLIVLTGIVGLILTSVGLAGMISRRVRELTVAIKNIESPHPLPAPVRSSSDELGALGAELEKTRETLFNKSHEIARLQKVRSEFLANVSHEVRTPLFSLKGFLETLLEGGLDDSRVNRSFLEKANHHAQRLDVLLRDLIEISRIESGDMRMSFRYFAVAPFLKQAFEDHNDAAVRKGQRIEFESVEADILGDRDRLRQVLDNLLENAVSYCPVGTTIRLQAIAGEKAVTFTVSDTGPGIAPEHLPRIFERFYRVDADRSREVGGTGLGLAIVKHIVEAHGSHVRVHSNLGQGTSFEFDIRI